MREYRSYGSVRGAPGDRRLYRDLAPVCARERARHRRQRGEHGELAPDGAPPSPARRTPRLQNHRLNPSDAVTSSISLTLHTFSAPC